MKLPSIDPRRVLPIVRDGFALALVIRLADPRTRALTEQQITDARRVFSALRDAVARRDQPE